MAKKNKNKWVSVTHKLPDPDEDVLCLLLFGDETENEKKDFNIIHDESYMIIADRIERYKDNFARGKRSAYIVSYWMPLPKMPKKLKRLKLRTEYYNE